MNDTQAVQEQAQIDAAYDKVVARAWSDPAYKSRLVQDPHVVLAEAGLSVAPDVTINVVENSDKVLNIVLPPPIEEGAFSDAELEQVAAGAACGAGFGTKQGCLTMFRYSNVIRYMSFRR